MVNYSELSEDKLQEIAEEAMELARNEFITYKSNLAKIPFGEDILNTLHDYAEKEDGHNFESPLAFEFFEDEKQIVLRRVSEENNCSLEVLENSWNRLMTEHLWGDNKTVEILDMRNTNITCADYRYGGWV